MYLMVGFANAHIHDTHADIMAAQRSKILCRSSTHGLDRLQLLCDIRIRVRSTTAGVVTIHRPNAVNTWNACVEADKIHEDPAVADRSCSAVRAKQEAEVNTPDVESHEMPRAVETIVVSRSFQTSFLSSFERSSAPSQSSQLFDQHEVRLARLSLLGLAFTRTSPLRQEAVAPPDSRIDMNRLGIMGTATHVRHSMQSSSEKGCSGHRYERSKKLLGAPGIATRSKDATRNKGIAIPFPSLH